MVTVPPSWPGAVDGEHDLAVAGRPVPGLERQLVHGPAGRGAADEVQRRGDRAADPGEAELGGDALGGERARDGGDAGHLRRVAQLGGRRLRGVDGDRDVRAVLRRERVVERAVRVGQHAEREGRGGGGGQDDQADDDGLKPPAAEAAAGGAEDGAHGLRSGDRVGGDLAVGDVDDPPGVPVGELRAVRDDDQRLALAR